MKRISIFVQNQRTIVMRIDGLNNGQTLEHPDILGKTLWVYFLIVIYDKNTTK